MGTHANAYIAYGIDIGENPPPNLTETQWEEQLETWKKEDIHTRGYEIINHCHYNYPKYFIAIPGTQHYAWQGSPKRINPYELEWNYTADQYANWRQAVNKLGLTTTEAGWHLMSHYA